MIGFPFCGDIDHVDARRGRLGRLRHRTPLAVVTAWGRVSARCEIADLPRRATARAVS
jgi:hypothetical protein